MQKSTSCQRFSSSLVECTAVIPVTQVRIWVLPELYSKNKDFFLIIEDKDYSKSRTKIGVSVDTKVWEIAQKLCGINLILHRYLWEHQNIWELSTQKIEQNLGKVKTLFILHASTLNDWHFKKVGKISILIYSTTICYVQSKIGSIIVLQIAKS